MSQNQEKLYIDVDEEITTVVDRLRHSPAQSVAVVVPQRAVLLQSIVNLKLLGREAKKLGKELVLMTKDEEGIVFASRAGIEVQPFVGSEENMMQQDLQSENYFSATPYQDTQQDSDNFFPEEDEQHNFQDNFKSETEQHAQVNQELEQQPEQQPEQKIIQERPRVQSMDVKVKRKKRVVSDSLRHPQQQPVKEQQQSFQQSETNNFQEQPYQDSPDFESYPEQNHQEVYQEKKQSFGSESNDFYDQGQGYQEESYYQNQQNHSQDFDQQGHSDFYDEPDPVYEKPVQSKSRQSVDYQDKNTPRSFESAPSYLSRKKPKAQVKEKNNWFSKSDKKQNKKQDKKLSLNDKKQKKDRGSGSFFSKWIITGGLLAVVAVGAFIVLPKTTLTVKIKEVVIDENVDLTAKVDQEKVDEERMTIPAREIEKEIVYTKSFDATGKADVDAQKAQGIVTLYNELSEAEERLVKNTRFLSEDGVLFRLAENTTVPGMKEVDGNKEFGKIKVLLVADKTGESGNIEATTFRIAAYKEKNNTQKYEKLYAKSDSVMQGGGVGGKNKSVVTEDDINKAKDVMEKSLPTFVETEMSDLIRDTEVVRKEAIEYKINASNSKVVKDTAVDKFEYEITAQVTVIIFSQSNVDELVNKAIVEKNKGVQIDSANINIEYNTVKPEFDADNLKMVIKATAKFKPEFDIEKFKNDIVGKSYEEIGSLVGEKYKQIDSSIESNTIPSFSFMSGKISQVKQMTNVIVK